MNEKNKSITLSPKMLAAMIIAAVLLIAGGVTVGLNWNNWFGNSLPAAQTAPGEGGESQADGQGKQPDLDDGAVDWQGEQPHDKPQTSDGKAGIAIPGYKEVKLKANEKEQSVNFYNPEVNTCYFVISLLLPDGTEIWKSKMIPPGKGLYQITLGKTVPAGTYKDSILKYECYKMDDNLSKLNGGEVKLILEVE